MDKEHICEYGFTKDVKTLKQNKEKELFSKGCQVEGGSIPPQPTPYNHKHDKQIIEYAVSPIGIDENLVEMK